MPRHPQVVLREGLYSRIGFFIRWWKRYKKDRKSLTDGISPYIIG